MSAPDFPEATPLVECLRQAKARDRLSFHTPGHLGRGLPGLELSHDTTELSFTDNLLSPRPSGPVEAAEEAAARYWRAPEALILAGGATLGIQAMLWHYAGRNSRILLTGAVHKAITQTCLILNIETVYLKSAMPAAPLPQAANEAELAAFLAEDADFQAFVCTTPDYYGRTCDLAAYKNVLEKYQIPLLVDQAHGAHLEAWQRYQGELSDFVANCAVISAHKTLPSMTGGAVLLAKAERSALRSAVDLFSSSSPSLLIGASVDYARHYAETQGVAQMARLSKALEDFKAALSPVYQVLESGDPLRLVIDVSKVGPGTEVARMLEGQGIVVELADLRRIVLIVALAQDPEALAELATAFNQLPVNSGSRPWVELDEKLKARMSAASGTEATGRALANDLVPYPPGIPLFRRGESLSQEDKAILKGLVQYGIEVNGLDEGVWL